MLDLMNLEDQVDREFSVARRRGRLRRFGGWLRGRSGPGTLRSFEVARRGRGGPGRRTRETVEVARIVGSAGKWRQFDEAFMPLGGASEERWKRVDRAFRRGVELPPVSLYRIRDAYFVADGHHRVSVARFHGVEWIDAWVTDLGASRLREPVPS